MFTSVFSTMLFIVNKSVQNNIFKCLVKEAPALTSGPEAVSCMIGGPRHQGKVTK